MIVLHLDNNRPMGAGERKAKNIYRYGLKLAQTKCLVDLCFFGKCWVYGVSYKNGKDIAWIDVT